MLISYSSIILNTLFSLKFESIVRVIASSFSLTFSTPFTFSTFITNSAVISFASIMILLLGKTDVNIKKISYEEAKLEDVFLSLTGKTLRD